MVKYSVCTFAIKLSFFLLDVIGLVVIAKKPVMPKDVSVSCYLSFTLLVRSVVFGMFCSLLTDVSTAFAVEFLLFSLVALNQHHLLALNIS